MILQLIDFIFIIIELAICIGAWRSRTNQAVLVHMIFFVFFVSGLQLVATHDISNDILVYLIAHMACLGYMVILYTLNLALNKMGGGEIEYAKIISGINDSVWNVSIYLWAIFQVFLIHKYGLASLYAFSGSINQASTSIDYFDAVLNALLLYSALGGMFIYITKAVLINSFLRRLRNLIPVTVYMFPFIALGGGGGLLGVRRTIFIMAAYALTLLLIKNKIELRAKLIGSKKKIFLIVMTLLVVTYYYQSIRNNMFLPEVYENLLSDSVSDQINGALKFAIPSFNNENLEPITLLRDGPFNLIMDVVHSKYYTGRSTDGELVVHEILKIVPHFLYPEKNLETDVDEIIAARMDLYPNNPYIKLDLSTSVLAILLADFGMIGIFFAPFLGFIAIQILTHTIVCLKNYSTACVFLMGALVYLVGNVEGGLAGIIGTIRDAFIFCIIVLPITVIFRWLKKSFVTGVASIKST